jgi:hypothetical protein
MGHTRRLEDRIRELSGRIASSGNSGQLDAVLPEFQKVIFEYLRRVENKTLAQVLNWPDFQEERRKIK